jgi:hypothetical protein
MAIPDVLDYRTKTAMALYRDAKTKLPTDFDLDTGKLSTFLDNLHGKATEQGWTTLLTIPYAGQNLYLLRHYGTISETAIKHHVQQYHFRQTREGQDATSLMGCLDATLTKDAHTTIHAERHKYTLRRGETRDATAAAVAAAAAAAAIAGTAPTILPVEPGRDEDEVTDGLLFLWCIINCTTAKTNATITSLIYMI